MKGSIDLTLPLIILVIIFAALALLAGWPSTNELSADVIVIADSKLMGFNADNDALHFGAIPAGNSGTRDIVLKNENSFAEKVKLVSAGEVRGWLAFSENNIVLAPKENKTVEVSLSVPADAELKQYSGRVRILNYRIWL